MSLTLRDTARWLNLPLETIRRWIEEGVLPARRVRGEYRLNKTELVEWAAARNMPLSPLAAEQAASPALSSALEEALRAGGVHHGLAAPDKSSALKETVAVMNLPPRVDRRVLLDILLAREKNMTTAVGNGVAVPHARNPLVLAVPRPLIALCFLKAPVDFGAPDGKPVHCLFTLVSPTIPAHLDLLSKLAFALRAPLFKEVIDRQGKEEEIFEAARRAERPAVPLGRKK